MLLVLNEDGTWNVDFDDGSEGDFHADQILLEGADAVRPAAEDHTAQLKSLKEEEAAIKLEHDSAVRAGNFRDAGGLLEKLTALQDAQKKLALGDWALRREREKISHRQRLEEMRLQFEREAEAAATAAKLLVAAQ